jgi:predicted transcriptional regulator
MGFFKDLEIDIIDMYREDGMKETEIAKSLGISVTQVHQVLSKYDEGDFDYDIQDADVGDVISYDDLTSEPSDSDYNSEHY